MNPFTEHPHTVELVKQVSNKKLDRKVYSDIVDHAGNQYVDLVQEGGGMLGIALAGYTYILEKAGIRFFSLAGTSAGAINTVMMAGLAPVGEPVSGKVLEILSSNTLFDLVDGNACLKRLIPAILNKKRFWRTRLALHLPLLAYTIWKHLGINPGKTFEAWIDEHLLAAGIQNMADLKECRKKLPEMLDRASGKTVHRQAGLKVITSEITTRSKVCFPEMAGLYWAQPDRLKPSVFVRASMSVPFFFRPLVVKDIPQAGQTEDRKVPKEKSPWRKHTGYRGKIPATVRFVDGGMLSNFPINAFHLTSGQPKKPTFGARLSTWREQYADTGKLFGFSGAMISTMRQLHDYDFLLRHPDYKQLICSIDADAKKDTDGQSMFVWLDFNMSQDKQLALFQLGARRAIDFLEGFSWEEYKASRKI